MDDVLSIREDLLVALLVLLRYKLSVTFISVYGLFVFHSFYRGVGSTF